MRVCVCACACMHATLRACVCVCVHVLKKEGFNFPFVLEKLKVKIRCHFLHYQGSLRRIQVNGRNASEFVPTAVVGMPTGVAVDWMSRNLYWTNAKAGLIEVMRLDGDNHYRKVLLSNSGRRRDAAQPISIALDPLRG